MHKDTDVHFDIMGESCFCGYVRIWNSRRSCCVAKNSKKVMDILWKKKNCVSARYVGWRFRNRREICVGTFACVLDKRMLGILVLKLRWSAYSHFSWACSVLPSQGSFHPMLSKQVGQDCIHVLSNSQLNKRQQKCCSTGLLCSRISILSKLQLWSPKVALLIPNSNIYSACNRICFFTQLGNLRQKTHHRCQTQVILKSFGWKRR